MLSRRRFLGSTCGFAISGAITRSDLHAGAQTPERAVSIDPVLSGYLALAPISIASLDTTMPLLYGNAKLQMDTFGYALPFELSDDEALHHWITATNSVALPSIFLTNALRDDFSDLTGFEIGQLFSGAEIGTPPDMVTTIRGDLDIDRIQTVQRSLGYEEIELDGRTVFSLSRDGTLDLHNPVQQLALGRLNNSAMLDEGTLVYTNTIELLETIVSPSGTTLDSLPPVQQALSTLDSALIGGAVLGPGAFLPGMQQTSLEPKSTDEIADFIRAQQKRTATPIVVAAIVGSTPGGPLSSAGGESPSPMDVPASVSKLSLVYSSAEDAAMAAQQIDERLATDRSMIRQTAWSELFADWTIEHIDDRSVVLLTIEWVARPHILELILSRDLGFITG